jgi:FKBP-type peptidyl-prolyl cis-trans isomerase FklB
MNKHIFATLGLGLLVCAARAQDQKPATSSPFKDDKDKVSYAIGLSTGTACKRMELDVEPDMVAKGMKDAMAGVTNLMSDQEMQMTLRKAQMDAQAKLAEKRKMQGEDNKKKGEEFIAQKKKEGAQSTPDGLTYKILVDGSGAMPKPEDTVTVNYKGTFIDGTEFDSSLQPGRQPFKTRVGGGVIRGWTEALQLMKQGSKWEIYLPASLAYGDYGQPPKIPPGATLVFEMELLTVEAAPPAQPAVAPQPLTSDIIKVPSAEGLKRGEKIETIKPEDIEKERQKELDAQKKNAGSGGGTTNK